MKQWEETIEELKREPLSEGVRDYLQKFFARKPAAPTPAPAAPGAPVVPNPAAGEKYIAELNNILNRAQQALSNYAQSLNVRNLKRSIGELDFRQVPQKPERTKTVDPADPVKMPAAAPTFSSPPSTKSIYTPPAAAPAPAPVPPAPAKKKKKSKDDLPINTIFNESQSREWRVRADGLEKVMTQAYADVLAFLQKMAKDSGYTPKNSNQIQSLVSEMKNFTILDKKTLHILRLKLIGFMITYRQLEGYMKLFRRTQQQQSASEKKAAKAHIP